MKYSEARPQMKTGDVIAFSGISKMSKLIQKWQGWRKDDYAYISHVALIMRTDVGTLTDKIFIAEATRASGLALKQLSLVWAQHGIPYWIPSKMNDTQRQAAYEFAVDKVTRGITYDLTGVLKNMFGAVSIDADHYYCTEFVWDDYVFSGYTSKKPENIAPIPSMFPVWVNTKPIPLDMEN